MDELIYRQQAIDALDVLCQEHRYRIPGEAETYSQYNEAWQDALDRAEGAIGNLPSAQPERDYKKAFSVACELLIGANLFGTTEETMFKEIMEKEGIVSSLGYEKYILENLARLTGEDDGTD